MLESRNGVFSILFSENVSLYNLFRGQFGRIYQGKGGLPSCLSGKESACQCRSHRDPGLIPEFRRSSGGGNGNSL